MLEKAFSTPEEITENYTEIGYKKASRPMIKQVLLGVLAGAFVALAAQGSNVGIHNIELVGIARVLSGALFSTTLMLVVIAGGELFTGNTLMVIALIKKRVTLQAVLRSWMFVYFGNIIGGLIIVILINASGQLNLSNGMVGGFTIYVATNKVHITFVNAFILGLLCNWLVCLAVWMASGAQDITGKILAIFFPVWLFTTSGFEHSIANIYYIPAGILAKSNPIWLEQALARGATYERIAHLTWESFIFSNLLPVTLGNLVGGAGFVGLTYLVAYGKSDSIKTTNRK